VVSADGTNGGVDTLARLGADFDELAVQIGEALDKGPFPAGSYEEVALRRAKEAAEQGATLTRETSRKRD
jgi:hypothetical protein